ncbi:MAG: histidine phosphatase family protein [Caldilineaceae bacterium]
MDEQIIYLIRHGSPQYPIDSQGRKLIYGPTAGLTGEGMLQCERLARRILEREGAPLDVLVTSPYTRAEETAAILARVMGTNVVVKEDRLRDTRSSWAGTLADDFMQTFYAGMTFDDPRTLESMEELGQRMKAAYDDIRIRYGSEKIGIVSHGDPIRALWFRLHDPKGEYPPYPELTKMIGLGAAEGLRLQIEVSGRVVPNQEIIVGE